MYDSRHNQIRNLQMQLSILAQAVALVDSDDPANDPDYQTFQRVIRQARKRIVDAIAKLED